MNAHGPSQPGTRGKGFWSRHPRAAIWVIAGVFYAILIGMCLSVLALILLR